MPQCKRYASELGQYRRPLLVLHSKKNQVMPCVIRVWKSSRKLPKKKKMHIQFRTNSYYMCHELPWLTVGDEMKLFDTSFYLTRTCWIYAEHGAIKACRFFSDEARSPDDWISTVERASCGTSLGSGKKSVTRDFNTAPTASEKSTKTRPTSAITE